MQSACALLELGESLARRPYGPRMVSWAQWEWEPLLGGDPGNRKWGDE